MHCILLRICKAAGSHKQRAKLPHSAAICHAQYYRIRLELSRPVVTEIAQQSAVLCFQYRRFYGGQTRQRAREREVGRV